MRTYSLRHVADTPLIDALEAMARKECKDLALMVAHIAEVDYRRLYLSRGYSSMFRYCLGKLNFSEDMAFFRIRAARAALRFPVIFEAIESGRVHLTGIVKLSPHLTRSNVDGLLAEATHKTKSDIERIVAAHFPRPDVPTLIVPIAPAKVASTAFVSPPVLCGSTKVVPEPLSLSASEQAAVEIAAGGEALAPERVEPPLHVPAPAPRPTVKPLSVERFAITFTMTSATLKKLEYAQALLSHRLPSGDPAEIFDRGLDLLITQLEKARFAATDKPRQSPPRASDDPRYIPAPVKRAVWKRDQGQCTFVSADGRRCAERKFLQYDHVNPVARGGRASEAMIRLRCGAHNRYEAEQIFGSEFMHQKLESARARAGG